MKMNDNPTESPTLDCVMTRLSRAGHQMDQMQRQCLTLAGAKARAEWILKSEPELANEFPSAEPLAGLLMSRARNGVGVFGNVWAASKP